LADWLVLLTDEVADWLAELDNADPQTAVLVAAAIRILKDEGPALGRPLVDTVKGSSVKNLKELRTGSSGRTEIRILFVFDPWRQAVLLVAGDKSGDWTGWYKTAIKIAERLYEEHLCTQEEERGRGKRDGRPQVGRGGAGTVRRPRGGSRRR
jgi:hypothetical protein